MTQIVQKIKSLQWQHFVFILLIAAIAVGSDGCKTTGKLSKKERKAQIELAKKQLTEIIDGTSTKPLEAQERTVNEIANKHFKDPELDKMIEDARQVIKKAVSERDKQKQEQVDAARAELLDMLLNKDDKSADELESELAKIKSMNLGNKDINDLIAKVEQKIAGMRTTKNVPLKNRLENAFQGIADASKSCNSNQVMSLTRSTLQLFSSDDTPVLIIISREGPDYDKPTNIKLYLEFLRDQKVNRNQVDTYELDGSGKIKSLDLIKK
jgi:chromatin segregation and condensation protein Rec8/ScpA/Scc1 (kleisin family)